MTVITLGSNSYNLIALPSNAGFNEASISMMDAVAVVSSPYVPSQVQTQTWPGADAWAAQLSLPKLLERQAGYWAGFFGSLRGMQNVFQLGDPARPKPLGVASGLPVVNSCVISLALGAGGSGYTTAPTVAISGGNGSGATAHCTISGGVVNTVFLDSGGTGFTSTPTVAFSGGGGSGAVATAQISNAPSATTLYTRGWNPSVWRQLLPKDYIQIGYRLYMACCEVDSDANGNAAISIFPSLRETPADGASLSLVKPQGVFRLASNKRQWHTGVDQLSQFSFSCTEVR